jgi:hypothetical protein
MKKLLLTLALMWTNQSFLSLEDATSFMLSLPVKRQVECKIVPEFIKEEYGLQIVYTIMYRVED